MTTFSPAELQRCIELLEAFVEDRTRLVDLDRDDRVRLLTAAGRLSRPTRDEQRPAVRAFRKQKRRDALAHDRAVTATTEIRAARRADVYVPPRQLASGAPDAGDARETS